MLRGSSCLIITLSNLSLCMMRRKIGRIKIAAKLGCKPRCALWLGNRRCYRRGRGGRLQSVNRCWWREREEEES